MESNDQLIDDEVQRIMSELQQNQSEEEQQQIVIQNFDKLEESAKQKVIEKLWQIIKTESKQKFLTSTIQFIGKQYMVINKLGGFATAISTVKVGMATKDIIKVGLKKGFTSTSTWITAAAVYAVEVGILYKKLYNKQITTKEFHTQLKIKGASTFVGTAFGVVGGSLGGALGATVATNIAASTTVSTFMASSIGKYLASSTIGVKISTFLTAVGITIPGIGTVVGIIIGSIIFSFISATLTEAMLQKFYQQTPYQIFQEANEFFGLTENSSLEELERKKKLMLLTWHPDKAEDSLKEVHRQKTIEILSHYEIIKNYKKENQK